MKTDTTITQAITIYVNVIGKQKYTIPIYRELVNGSAEAKKLALEAYEETKNLIHAQVRERIERLLDDMKK